MEKDMNIEEQYLDILGNLIEYGEYREDRTGVGVYSIFGTRLQHDFSEGFPLLTTKNVWFKGVLSELLWFLSGSTNIKDLHEYDNHIWDEWADETGELGPIYGKQWRSWQGPNGIVVDQIQNLINNIKTNPFSRRNLVISYNPGELPEISPPGCHTLFQVYITNDGKLDLQLYQRSADFMLGVPFNIASYATLMYILCHITGYKLGKYTHIMGDTHLYKTHVEGARIQYSRKDDIGKFPQLNIKNFNSIDELTMDHFKISGYKPLGKISLPISI